MWCSVFLLKEAKQRRTLEMPLSRSRWGSLSERTKSKREELQIDICGFQQRDVANSLFEGLKHNMMAQDIDSRCP